MLTAAARRAATPLARPRRPRSSSASASACCLNRRNGARSHSRGLATYAWGACDDGHLGVAPDAVHPDPYTFGRNAPAPARVPSLAAHHVVALSASGAHAAAVAATGQLLVAGRGARAAAGAHAHAEPETGEESKGGGAFVPVGGLPPVVDVACGAAHTLVATARGHVLAAGSNSHGQLGAAAPPGDGSASTSAEVGVEAGAKVRSPYPPQWYRVPGLGPDDGDDGDAGGRVVQVVAGDRFSAALDDRGAVYTWGASGPALGHADAGGSVLPSALRFVLGGAGGDAAAAPLARRVRDLPPIRALAAGKRHLVALDRAGRAYAWGDARHFVLAAADGDDAAPAWAPRRAFDGLGALRKVACGGAHALALSDAGVVFAVGDGDHGCLGTGNIYPQPLPVPLPADRLPNAGVADIAAGWYASAAVDKDGRVWTWGSCAGGALGLGPDATADAYEPQLTGVVASRVVMSSSGMSMFAIGDRGDNARQ